jgi:hypothetical protein
VERSSVSRGTTTAVHRMIGGLTFIGDGQSIGEPAPGVIERLRTIPDKVGALGDSASLRLGNDREKALRSAHACKPKMWEMRVLSESIG